MPFCSPWSRPCEQPIKHLFMTNTVEAAATLSLKRGPRRERAARRCPEPPLNQPRLSTGTPHPRPPRRPAQRERVQPSLTSPTTLENVVPLPQIPTGDPRVLALSHTDR
ncbi:hypothetical protein GCM10018965_018720 [Nonomuraea roseola]